MQMRLQKAISQIMNELMALTIVTKIGVYDCVYIFTGLTYVNLKEMQQSVT